MAVEPLIPARRILVTRLKFIGDVVLTTPLLHSLRAAYPSARIAYMAEAHACSLLRHHPAVDELIDYDISRPAVFEQARVALALRRARFDIALDLFSNPRTALLTYLSGAPVRVGLARAGRGRLFTHQVRDNGVPKTAVRFLDQFLHAIGVAPAWTQPFLAITPGERETMLQRLRTLDAGILASGGTRRGTVSRAEEVTSARAPAGGRDGAKAATAQPIVVAHVGATWPAKQWGAARYATLATLLWRKAGARVLLAGGPHDDATLDEVAAKSDGAGLRVGPLTLRELAALLSVADAFVGNDGGPMHISAAVGTPTVGIFGPGQENIWFPYSETLGHRALREDVVCHPCHLNVCNRPGELRMECMKKLAPERVLEAVLWALAQAPDRRNN